MLEDIANVLLAELTRTHTPLAEIALRLALAAILAGAIGFEREMARRSAGLRTHMLVSLAAATFTIGAIELLHWTNGLEDSPARVDPARALEAITAGVAFLAAGTIIQSRRGTLGLTTGAGMWLAGSIGLVTGIGLYAFAITTTLIGLIILFVVRYLEQAVKIKPQSDAEREAIGGKRETESKPKDDGH